MSGRLASICRPTRCITWSTKGSLGGGCCTGLWGSAADSIWTSPVWENGESVLFHWDGGTWSRDYTGGNCVASVAGTGASDVWCGGMHWIP